MRYSGSSGGRPFGIVGGRVDTAILSVTLLANARVITKIMDDQYMHKRCLIGDQSTSEMINE
jgi:thiamine pyrophosphokinase